MEDKLYMVTKRVNQLERIVYGIGAFAIAKNIFSTKKKTKTNNNKKFACQSDVSIESKHGR